MLEGVRVPVDLAAVSDGEEGLRILREQSEKTSFKPDLLVIDINLPRMNRREMIEEAGELLDDIEILVFTGSTLPNDEIPRKHLSMTKPFGKRESSIARAELERILRSSRPRLLVGRVRIIEG